MHAFVSVVIGLLVLGCLVAAGLVTAGVCMLLIASVIDAVASLFGGGSSDRHAASLPSLHASPR